ncbi:hypothetical protein K431DRAFT_320483 [Polychaeton citri CBS 116435]|uniref:DDE-1 domain-containing protein n=1 Tax=Polychaeton citri CBS 116435 TaxID=1314669 RepID=A0A9P4Q5Y4_9PEZI|nr:hypothetical protein K431DRAFT_320483 [Polychaeton citri CBS 116435]
MDETGVLLSVLGSIKALVNSKEVRAVRPSCVQRTLITAVECILANARAKDKPRLLISDGFGTHESLEVERLYRGGANTISKQHFTLLYSKARQVAFTARNIRASWSKAGLFPFSPDRVLKDMEQLASKLYLQKMANAVEKLFADRALLFDENKLLFEQNNKKSIRDSTRGTVVGRAKVMSYNDLVEAQRKRSEKEARKTQHKQPS